jgi:hypothetical protein
VMDDWALAEGGPRVAHAEFIARHTAGFEAFAPPCARRVGKPSNARAVSRSSTMRLTGSSHRSPPSAMPTGCVDFSRG